MSFSFINYFYIIVIKECTLLPMRINMSVEPSIFSFHNSYSSAGLNLTDHEHKIENLLNTIFNLLKLVRLRTKREVYRYLRPFSRAANSTFVLLSDHYFSSAFWLNWNSTVFRPSFPRLFKTDFQITGPLLVSFTFKLDPKDCIDVALQLHINKMPTYLLFCPLPSAKEQGTCIHWYL